MRQMTSATETVQGFPGLRALVIGDAMLDTWLEGEAILAALAKRVAAIEITGSVKRLYNNTLRGLESLPLALTPAT